MINIIIFMKWKEKKNGKLNLKNFGESSKSIIQQKYFRLLSFLKKKHVKYLNFLEIQYITLIILVLKL